MQLARLTRTELDCDIERELIIPLTYKGGGKTITFLSRQNGNDAERSARSSVDPTTEVHDDDNNSFIDFSVLIKKLVVECTTAHDSSFFALQYKNLHRLVFFYHNCITNNFMMNCSCFEYIISFVICLRSESCNAIVL